MMPCSSKLPRGPGSRIGAGLVANTSIGSRRSRSTQPVRLNPGRGRLATKTRNRSGSRSTVGTCAWLAIQPPWPSARKTMPRFRQRRPGSGTPLARLQHPHGLASDDLVQPVMQAYPELLARLHRQRLGFRRHALEPPEVAGVIGAAARARDREVEIGGRLAFADGEVQQIERAADDPTQVDLARFDRHMLQWQRGIELRVGQRQRLGESGLAQPGRHALVADDDAAADARDPHHLAEEAGDVAELTDAAEL